MYDLIANIVISGGALVLLFAIVYILTSVWRESIKTRAREPKSGHVSSSHISADVSCALIHLFKMP